MNRDDPRHGTYAGAQKHRHDAEEVCPPCREAAAAYIRAWRKTAKQDHVRNLARKRALSALARAHPADYERLYVTEVNKALNNPRPDAEIVRLP